MSSTLRPDPGTIPESPGVYRFWDDRDSVIYVGKAKSLRSRLSSYFQDPRALAPRTRAMVATATSVDWVVVNNEVEALQLEYSWIKEHDPRFNVKYRDDKSYPFLAVTMFEEYPRITVMRGDKRAGVRYFGPYAHAWAIRETVDLLLRVFPARTCSAGVFKRARASGRPCLLGYIDRCSAPCVDRVSADEHRAIVLEFCDFMSGRGSAVESRLQQDMAYASAALDFERAARLRDDLRALHRATERSAVVLADSTDADVIAVADDDLQAAAQIFHVRGGRVRGQRGLILEKSEDATAGDLIEKLIVRAYAPDGLEVPRELLVSAQPPAAEALCDWLRQSRGGQVAIRVPQRGDKRRLMDTVARNAQQGLDLHKLRRGGDLTARGLALQEIQEALGLSDAPLRIECIDISHLQGSEAVGSLVVFEDGLPRTSDYRHYAIRADRAAGDDLRSIQEVVERRFRRLRAVDDAEAEQGDVEPGTGETDAGVAPGARPARFAYPPQLLLIDGGPLQAQAAQGVLERLGIVDVAVAGLAKRLEEVWIPGEPEPVIMSRSSEGLFLLQRVRDEAHRFAIRYHRTRRAKRATASALDGIPGLGDARRKALLRAFGSVKRLRSATAEEMESVPGIGPTLARSIVAALAGETPAPGGGP